MGARGDGIVLIGLRRAGKSSVGRKLAEALGRPLVDLDRVIEGRVGGRAADLLRESVEEFRRAELAALEDVVASLPGSVLAPGGGAPETPACRPHLRRHGTILYLAVSVEEHLRRLSADPDPAARPLLAGGDPAEEIRILHRRRDPLYRALADWSIHADVEVDAVAAACLRALGHGGAA